MFIAKHTKIAIIALFAIAAISIPSAYAKYQVSFDDYCDPFPKGTDNAKFWLCHYIDARLTALESSTVVNGTNGVDGLTGPQGINGTIGLTGPQGIQGEQGINGVNGTNNQNSKSELRYSQFKMVHSQVSFDTPHQLQEVWMNTVPQYDNSIVEVDYGYVAIFQSINGVSENIDPDTFVLPSGMSIDFTVIENNWFDFSHIQLAPTCTIIENMKPSDCNFVISAANYKGEIFTQVNATYSTIAEGDRLTVTIGYVNRVLTP